MHKLYQSSFQQVKNWKDQDWIRQFQSTHNLNLTSQSKPNNHWVNNWWSLESLKIQAKFKPNKEILVRFLKTNPQLMNKAASKYFHQKSLKQAPVW